jgi:hypothetical protein
MRHQTDQPLRQFDHALGRAIEAVALLHLPARGLVDFGVTMAEDHGTPATHEIEIFAAVDVPEMAALAAREKLRIAFGQTGGPHVAVHAAGHHLKRALTQALVEASNPAFGQSHLSSRVSKKDIRCGSRHNRLIHASAASFTHGAPLAVHSMRCQATPEASVGSNC